MRARPLLLSALAGLSLLTLGVCVSVLPAQAQTTPSNVTAYDAENTEIHEALRALFKNSGVSYAIAPEVSGTVTLHLKNVPFEAALQNLTRQVDATYRVENGVYMIVAREAAPTPTQFGGGGIGGGQAPMPTPVLAPPAEVPVVVSEGDYLYVVARGVVTKIDKKAMRVVGTVTYAGGLGGGGFGR